MKNPFLLLTFFLLSLLAAAQDPAADDPRAQFVGLNNGQRVYAKRVQIKSPLLKSNYFLLDDSIRYAMEAVKYYQNEQGFFLKISDPYGRDDFARRIVSGRISKYSISRTDYTNAYGPGYNPYGYGGYGGYGMGGYGWGTPTRRNIYFFSKDEGQLQSFTFNNLAQAMADNPGSVAMLEKYRQGKRIETGLSLVGAGLLVYGFTQSFNQVGANGFGGVTPTVYAGAALISIPWVSGLFKKDRLTQAIELYNYSKREQ